MILIANVLVMNGGTTFYIRLAKAFAKRGRRAAVLVLFDEFDPKLLAELQAYASVFRLSDYATGFGKVLLSRLRMFGPLDLDRLAADLRPYSSHLHVQGIFGLFFAARIKTLLDNCPVSAGVYHQNEFLFTSAGSHLETEAMRLFAALPASNVIFFNETSRDNYQTFYRRDYSEAPLLPIGIDLGALPEARSPHRPGSIVSVGNLVGFKTYNEHMIRIVAQLSPYHPDLRYDIYGTGDQREPLQLLIDTLGVADRVRLRGELDYGRFAEVVAPATLFVGSGTAILEASALGVPSIVGIESIRDPLTYGFLSDVQGYSYNEDMPGVTKTEMVGLVSKVLTDGAFARQVGRACQAKAITFSIDHTTNGFEALEVEAKPMDVTLDGRDALAIALSTLWVSILHVLRIDRTFAERRNQSFSAS